MVARYVRKSRRGGRRAGAGRRPGSIDEAKRVARAQAARRGMLPDELLLEWARSGKMASPDGGSKSITLAPSERISCARGAAPFYKAPVKPAQEPERPRVLTIDESVLRALVAAGRVDKLEVLRDVLQLIQAGGVDPGQLAPSGDAADAGRYASMLTPDSRTAGRA